MTTPVSNILHRMNTPQTNSAPALWNTTEFHTDIDMVTHRLREGVGSSDNLDRFLEFLASPNGNRVLTYNVACHEGVKQFICEIQNAGSTLSTSARQHINRICENQGWENPVG